MTPDERFDRLDAAIERVFQDVREVREDVREVREDVRNLRQYVLEMREEIASRLDILDRRLDIFAATTANMESRFPPLTKAILDFGSTASKVARDQQRAKEVDADLLQRVARLQELMAK